MTERTLHHAIRHQGSFDLRAISYDPAMLYWSEDSIEHQYVCLVMNCDPLSAFSFLCNPDRVDVWTDKFFLEPQWYSLFNTYLQIGAAFIAFGTVLRFLHHRMRKRERRRQAIEREYLELTSFNPPEQTPVDLESGAGLALTRWNPSIPFERQPLPRRPRSI